MNGDATALSSLVELYGGMGLPDRALLLASAGVAILFLVSLGFALFAVRTRLLTNARRRRKARLEEAWTAPTLAALVGETPLEDVHGRVGPEQALSFLTFLGGYARRVVGEERERVMALAEPYLDALNPELEDRDPAVRTRAAEILGTLGLPRRGESLLRLLDDPSPFVAMVAAQGLARHGRPAHARQIVSRLDRFEGWNREHLVGLLRAVGHTVAPELRRLLVEKGGAPMPIRTVAIDALRGLHDLKAVDIVVDLLGTESDPDLLTAALRLVAELGRPGHLEAIRPHLASPHFPVRAAAFGALGALGTPGDHDRLRAGIDDPSPWVARQAARGLRSSGGEPALRTLAASSDARATLAAEVLEETRA